MDFNVCKDGHTEKGHEQFVIRCGAILNNIYYYGWSKEYC